MTFADLRFTTAGASAILPTSLVITTVSVKT